MNMQTLELELSCFRIPIIFLCYILCNSNYYNLQEWSMLTIEKVDTENKSQVKRFVQYYYDLYKDCPQWVPPLIYGCLPPA